MFFVFYSYRLSAQEEAITNLFTTGTKTQNLEDGIILQVGEKGGEIKATVSRYEGKVYLNVRLWVKGDVACKQGVTFGYEGWSHVKSFMGGDLEVQIAMAAYAKALRLHHKELHPCEGCAINHPSQDQHSCMMDEGPSEADHFEAIPHVQPWDVILIMAEMAKDKKFLLQSPGVLYNLCKYCLNHKVARLAIEVPLTDATS